MTGRDQPDPSLIEILDRWRELERSQAAADPDERAHGELELEIARLRSEYHRRMALNVAHAAQPVAATREARLRTRFSAELAAATGTVLREVREPGRSRPG